jgi:hypothetical protein
MMPLVVETTPPLEMKPGQPVEGREESEHALNPSASRLISSIRQGSCTALELTRLKLFENISLKNFVLRFGVAGLFVETEIVVFIFFGLASRLTRRFHRARPRWPGACPPADPDTQLKKDSA